ncbi:MAG: NAD(P)H-dependent glycerol-3-phosphate dehydrogenase [Mariprofundales bacterium]|nr:NAD(P)H-dependent glycerol-3-phosphate dehydrogenase [Mariprofundales bacterium]
MSDNHYITVIGGGSWGTALAVVLARGGNRVHLLVRTPHQAAAINRDHRNPDYLSSQRLSASIEATDELTVALAGTRAVIYALPCMLLPEMLAHIVRVLDGRAMPIVAACKGLQSQSGLRVDQVMAQVNGGGCNLLLSGPSFADEVAQGVPTAITLAATEMALARQVAPFFDGSTLRIYLHDDVVGVALGGALKNVIAIAAGIADGLQLGNNALAALVTRGIHEMTRIAVACGAQQATMYGLAGLGDLVLTCHGGSSRNRQLGLALAAGLDVAAARRRVGQVVEGERSARMALSLAQQHQVDAPIVAAVCAVLDGSCSCQQALDRLLQRPLRAEFS